MESSHADLEKWHYEALKNPAYQLDGMMDVLMEELSMSMPYRILEPIETPRPVFKPRPVDYEIDQLKSQLIYLKNELNLHVDKSTKKKPPTTKSKMGTVDV